MILISLANRIAFHCDIRVCFFNVRLVLSLCEIWAFAFIRFLIFVICWFGLLLFSFKKSNNNAQGGQSRASVPTVNSPDSNASTPRGTPNGAHIQPQLQGMNFYFFYFF